MQGFQAHPGCWQNPPVTVGLRRLPPCWLSLEATLAPWGLSGPCKWAPKSQGRQLLTEPWEPTPESLLYDQPEEVLCFLGPRG